MSSLRHLEKDCFEALFDMSSGYVMDFSNRTFNEFFRDSVRIDIYSDKYAFNGDSKARRLRAFIEEESDEIVGKTLSELLEYWRYRNPEPTAGQNALLNRANQAITRILG